MATLRRKRPVNLNLLTIRMPVAAVMSIAHRASGLLMFGLTPFLLYLLDLSLRGPEGFRRAADLLAVGGVRLVLVAGVWALAHHFFAGIRYLLLDLEVGLDKPVYRHSAAAVLGAGGVVALIAAGVLL